MFRLNLQFIFGLAWLLNIGFSQVAWACNCISSGGSEHLLNTYLGITILISLLPICFVGGGIFLLYRLHRNRLRQVSEHSGASS